MPDPIPPAAVPVIPLATLITAISDYTRWRIFNELLKGEPLPVIEIARRLGLPGTNISKHMVTLRDFGLVLQGYGRLYRLDPRFLVPGQRALDFGPVLLRFDSFPS